MIGKSWLMYWQRFAKGGERWGHVCGKRKGYGIDAGARADVMGLETWQLGRAGVASGSRGSSSCESPHGAQRLCRRHN